MLCYVMFRAYYFETSYDFFFRFFFFQFDRPTQYQETYSTVNEEKKGDGLILKKCLNNNNVYLHCKSQINYFIKYLN